VQAVACWTRHAMKRVQPRVSSPSVGGIGRAVWTLTWRGSVVVATAALGRTQRHRPCPSRPARPTGCCPRPDLEVGRWSGSIVEDRVLGSRTTPPSSQPSALHPTSASTRLLSVVRRNRSWFSRGKHSHVLARADGIWPLRERIRHPIMRAGSVGRDAAALTSCMPSRDCAVKRCWSRRLRWSLPKLG
jgi:hypothetical protein